MKDGKTKEETILAPSSLHTLALLLLSVLALCLASCKQEPAPAEVAAQTAKAYYDHLLQGRYADYVDGTYRPDSIPDSYRQQLIDNAKMFVWQMKTEHQGMKSVAINGATYDEKTQSANVYLVIVFLNGESEQIVVPMLFRNGLWLMR